MVRNNMGRLDRAARFIAGAALFPIGAILHGRVARRFNRGLGFSLRSCKLRDEPDGLLPRLHPLWGFHPCRRARRRGDRRATSYPWDASGRRSQIRAAACGSSGAASCVSVLHQPGRM